MNVKLVHSEKGMIAYTDVRKIDEVNGDLKIFQEGGFHIHHTDMITSLKAFAGEE